MSILTVTTGADSAVNGTNFQATLNSAVAGDTIILTAGATYDGTFILADKSASVSTPITIKSSATLPERRIGPGDVALLAKCRTLGGGNYGAVFQFSANASWWIIDGIEMVDNGPSGTLVSAVIDCTLSSVHDITVKRCYVHNKETGSDYYRYIRFCISFEGSGLTVKWNYVSLLGYYPLEFSFGTYSPIDTIAIASVGGNTITVLDNYLSTWYSSMFTGGGDTLPQNTATISSSSTTSGTFSNVTGLAAGVVIRFDLDGTATSVISGNTMTLTRTGGIVVTSPDIGRSVRVTAVGTGQTGIVEISAVSGNTITTAGYSGAWSTIPDGNVTFQVYETALVDSVAGSVVNYTPFGLDALNHAPAAASWNYGDQGLVYDVPITKNTFYIDPDFAAHVQTNNGNFPKGFAEFKNTKRMTLDGNQFLGYSSLLAWTSSNQTGTAPWITTSDVTVTNNTFSPTTTDGNRRPFIIFADNDYIKTVTPSINLTILNNLILNCQNLGDIGAGSPVVIQHNTVVNLTNGLGYNSIVTTSDVLASFSFYDNIVSYLSYGLQCFLDPFTFATCYPSGTFQNNVVVDQYSAGVTTSTWGVGSILSPVPTSFDNVSFIDVAAGNYRLAGGSTYKNLASDGADPGVDMDALLAAQGTPPRDGDVIRKRRF